MSVLTDGLERCREFLGRARAPSPGKKPAELIYGVDDVPPLYIILLSGLQHVGLVTIFLIYPLLIVKEVGASMTLAANILSLALIALGIATFLQGLPKGPVGSGFLCPANHTAIYLAPSLAAVKLGGLPLLFGMTIFAGVVECILSPVLRRIRPLIPPELSGLVIFFVGMTVAAVGFRYIAGIGSSEPIGASNVIVALITLGVTAGLNVWAKGNARLFCALIGMAIGYLAAIATGILSTEQFRMIAELPLLALPSLSHLHWTMSAEMIPPFIIIAIAATLKTVGVITACQRINDASWVRPDMASLSRGVLADGMGTAAAGALGSVGLNTSTPCTGLAAATGLTSRVVGYAAGGILMLLGFLPMLTGVFVLMPRPVMGAALIFAACFILINGLQAITSRMLDARRTLVIGLALSAGFAAEIFPDLADRLPVVLKPIVGSSLVLGTLTALLLKSPVPAGPAATRDDEHRSGIGRRSDGGQGILRRSRARMGRAPRYHGTRFVRRQSGGRIRFVRCGSRAARSGSTRGSMSSIWTFIWPITANRSNCRSGGHPTRRSSKSKTVIAGLPATC